MFVEGGQTATTLIATFAAVIGSGGAATIIVAFIRNRYKAQKSAHEHELALVNLQYQEQKHFIEALEKAANGKMNTLMACNGRIEAHLAQLTTLQSSSVQTLQKLANLLENRPCVASGKE